MIPAKRPTRRSILTSSNERLSKATERSAEHQPPASKKARKASDYDIGEVTLIQPKSSPREQDRIPMDAIPAAPSFALEAESGSPKAATSVDPVSMVVPIPPVAPVPVTVSEPVIDSASASTALASVASSPINATILDPQNDLMTGPAATSASSSAHSPSVAQAALALATALRDAGSSISNESLVTDIVTAFIRARPEPISTTATVTKSTEPVTPAINTDVRPKEMDNRIDLVIANVNESLLKLSAEQRRLENLINENIQRTKTRLTNMKRKIAELDEATSEMM